MKKLHKYEMIVEDDQNIYKVYTVAENQTKAKNFCVGNGEVVRVKEISDYLPSAWCVRQALYNSGFGEAECDLIYRLLYMYLEGTNED